MLLNQLTLKTLLHYNPYTGVFTHLSGRNKGKSAGGIDNSTGYLQLWVEGKKYRLHTLAWLYITGSFPEGIIDHKNRVKTDNRFSNLRDTTHSINNLNKGITSSNTSGVSGVSWDKNRNRWNVKIYANGKRLFCRYFKTLEEATRIRLQLQDTYKDLR